MRAGTVLLLPTISYPVLRTVPVDHSMCLLNMCEWMSEWMPATQNLLRLKALSTVPRTQQAFSHLKNAF